MKKYNKLLLLFYYFLICFMANFLAVIFQVFLRDVMFTPEMLDISTKVWGNLKYSEVMTFVLPTLLIVFYTLPMIRFLISGKEPLSLDDRIKRKFLNTPFVISLFGMIGWLLALIYSFYGIIQNKVKITFDFLIISNFFCIINALLCFVITYYLTELINRKFMIPEIFPDGKLSRFKGVLNPSIRTRFIIYYISTTLFPIFILFNIIFAVLMKFNIPELLIKISFTTLGLLIISFFINFLISSYFKAPLKELKKATTKISESNFDISIQEVSSDEIGSLIESVNQMAKEIKEKEFIKDTFGKMVDPSVRDYLLSGNIRLGGEEHKATILFSDIRDFTSLSEKLEPNQIVDILNLYFETMTDTVINNNGLVNKYIGDAILAVYGVPVTIANSSDHALSSAVNMMRLLDKINVNLIKSYNRKLSIGIGIHYGNVLAGNIGSKVRMEYTVIGDTVNLASRLESLTKTYKVPIIISSETRNNLRNSSDFLIREIDTTSIKGKEREVTIHEVICDEEKIDKMCKIIHRYNESIELFKSMKYKESDKLFKECLEVCKDDTIINMYIERCNLRNSV